VSAINNLQELVLWDYPIPYASIPNIIAQTQIEFPTGNLKCTDNLCLAVCSCDGILCFTTVSGGESAILWNPSIRRFNILPPLKFSSFGGCFYSFGYDSFIDNYKVVAVSFYADFLKVNVHTFGTDYWRRTHDLPYSNVIRQPGVIVNGSVHWLLYDVFWSIVSLDLEKDSYQNLLLPDKVEIVGSTLELLRDCLCIFTNSSEFFDVWVLKDYENQESWTKLYHIPCKEYIDIYPDTNAIYVSEDDQVLMYFRKFMELTLAVYDSKNDTLNIPMFGNICPWLDPKVYVESLISPCS
jgi:F-box interacting protein